MAGLRYGFGERKSVGYCRLTQPVKVAAHDERWYMGTSRLKPLPTIGSRHGHRGVEGLPSVF